MAQVTIRRVDEAWVEKAREEASRLKVPMNQVLVDALRRGLGAHAEPVKKPISTLMRGTPTSGPSGMNF
jgi:hypothetical protein